MFDSSDYPLALDEALFENWLVSGREKKICYNYLLVVWNAHEEIYQPVYVETRDEIAAYEWYPNNSGQEGLVAVYDLYSESRINRWDLA